MSDSETQHQPLMGGYPAINVPAEGGRSTRAYKIAGITVLACILVAGQVMTAYFLFSQRSDIQSLEQQHNDMNAELTRGRSVAVPVRMHMPMKGMPLMMDDSVDETSTEAKENSAPPQTDCQLEAAGMKPIQVPGFRPRCDERGLYHAQQCFRKHCWCVNPVNGETISGSDGRTSCSMVLPGRMTEMLALPEVKA